VTYANSDALVSTVWLAEHLDAPDVRIVDATWFLPNSDRNARVEFEDCHIPGSVFFDINEIADAASELPHMLPSPEKFSRKVQNLGLGDGSQIIVYDGNGGFMAAARVWWTFRVFGHKDVAVLDGGLPKWLIEGRATDDIPPPPRKRHFTARTNTLLVRNVDQMIKNVESKREQVIDARSAERFAGADPEPRPTQKRGHIPGSICLPFNSFMDDNACFIMRSADEIKAALDEARVDLSKPIVTTCGSGVTASLLSLGLYLIGHADAAVYDGSWAEWGEHSDTPVAAD